jgi:hypothetical protein
MDSQIFAHPVALKIWVWCLLKASHKERFVSLKVGKGITTIKVFPGQFIFGRMKAEEELGINGSTIYKWIQKFASDAFDCMISLKSNNQYTVVTITKWAIYQALEGGEVTTEEQPSNNQITAEKQPSNTDNNVNNVNNVNNGEMHMISLSTNLMLLEKRETAFREECEGYIGEYGKDMVRAFVRYWTEKNKSKTRMRFEKESTWETSRRLVTWSNNEKSFNKSGKPFDRGVLQSGYSANAGQTTL